MELSYKYPNETGKVIHNMEVPPNTPQPEACIDSGYMDGSVQAYPGVNPGRDQDRDRQCECIPASYSYPQGGPASVEMDNETGVAEGF